MHKIQEKEFTIEDFSTDQITDIYAEDIFLLGVDANYYKHHVEAVEEVIKELNLMRRLYLGADRKLKERDLTDAERKHVVAQRKRFWWNMIQILPSSYNQTRNVMMNYQVLVNIYKSRKNHKLDEWREFCKWIESLPQSELIIMPDRNKEMISGWNPISKYKGTDTWVIVKDVKGDITIACQHGDGNWYDQYNCYISKVVEFFDMTSIQ